MKGDMSGAMEESHLDQPGTNSPSVAGPVYALELVTTAA
jgi:hypothetical protein